MAETMVVPQLGNSVESVVLLDWKVEVGAKISEGDVVCEVETDKATMDVEATVAGTLLKRLAAEGDELAVRAPLLIVGDPDESAPDDAGAATAAVEKPQHAAEAGGAARNVAAPNAASTPPGPVTPAPSHAAPLAPASGTAAVSPRARMSAGERGIDAGRLSGTGPGGRVIERDVLSAAVPATAAARAAGVSGDAVPSGPGGRVTLADSIASREGADGSPARATTAPAGTAAVESYQSIRVAGVRKVIAERMLASLQQTAQLTLHSAADARALQSLRGRIKSGGAPLGLESININDMVMYAVARTVGEFPDVNAHFLDTEIRRFAAVDLGFATDTPRGLLVPTVQRADTLSLAGLSARIKELARTAIDGKAGAAELAPATFTVTNLGAFGVERFTPVLNPPQVAILGVGSIELKAVASDGAIEHVPHIGLSLTIDHRAVDGAPAARFLKTLAERIAAFDLLLAV